MGATQQQPPSGLGPEPDGSGASSPWGVAPSGAAADRPSTGRPSQDRPAAVRRETRRLALDGASGVVPLARDFTRQALHEWGWLPAATAEHRAAAEDVLLVVSELVTNACLHADGPEELRVTLGPKVLRLEVTDRGTGQPAPRTPHRAGRPGGHGMFIVQRLCLDWGVTRAAGAVGKTVWAELAAPA
ncbi:ATP-binding protein [Streptomyces sp. TRM64462]|uniref:ATP-binding protein n=1 Tax=Streptomyces sp. TRM64462 TaxID=2741726 RepID=UPI001586A697|nr:ATP-binding protein [Streptomyces sp. TRM64462]